MKNLIRLLVSALLFFFAWPPDSFAVFLSIAFVPLFFIDYTGVLRQWLSAFVVLFLWNTSTTFWIYNLSWWAAPIVHLLNALLFSLPFLMFYSLRGRVSALIVWILFISSWLSIELLHLSWQLAYTFLTLGYGLARYPLLFQWY